MNENIWEVDENSSWLLKNILVIGNIQLILDNTYLMFENARLILENTRHLHHIVMVNFFCVRVVDVMGSGHNTHFRVGGVWDLFILFLSFAVSAVLVSSAEARVFIAKQIVQY